MHVAWQCIPRARRVCIGFISEGWLTVFGPPTTLQRLFEWSAELDDAPHMDTDARGGVHLETLPEIDVGRVLGTSPWLDRGPVAKATIISPYTCQPRQEQTLRELLGAIISDVGQRTLHLATSMKAAIDLVQTEKLRVIIPGYTPHDVVFLKTLQKRGIEYSVLSHRDHSAPGPGVGRRAGSGLVAVVGMSGRFPGSGDVEAFWQNLLQGIRFVQEVSSHCGEAERRRGRD